MRNLAKLIMLGATLAPAVPVHAQQAAFFDDFDRLDTSRWYVSDGWSNGAHQNCTWSADQVWARDGLLQVGVAPLPKGDRQYRCGEIQTRQALGFGTYEARLKTPSGSGLNAAFFTYIGPQQGKPHDEIDFEILLRDTSHVDTTTFVNGVSGDGEIGSGQSHALPHGSDEDFVTFAFTCSCRLPPTCVFREPPKLSVTLPPTDTVTAPPTVCANTPPMVSCMAAPTVSA